MEPRRRSRRASRRRETEIPAWEEPEPTLDNPTLKSTSQSISDFPPKSALATIEDPERRKRQLNRQPTKPRKSHRSAEHTNEASPETESRDATEEKLYIKLQSRLMPGGSEISNIRETPKRGEEDYRHERTAENEIVNGGSKRLSSGDSPGAKRARRAARPSFESTFVDPDMLGESHESTPEPESKFSKRHSRQDPELKSREKSARLNGSAAGSKNANEHKLTEEPGSPKPAALRGKIKKGVPENDGAVNDIVNNDYCTACGGTGEFLCCETCPRSFHFSCIETPVIDVDELPDEPWSCRHCAPRRFTEEQKSRISKTLFGSLIIAFESQNAMAFQLPSHLRDMFSHIQTSKYGEYLDEPMKSEGIPQGSRLQDKNGNILLCFKCHESTVRGKPLAICSKCRESWHIDCVDPPLESTPMGYWVCPLHAENATDLPLRVRKPIMTDVALKRQVRNDGDIEITDDEDDSRVDATEFNGGFSDEEVVKHVNFPAQARALPDGSIIAKGPKHRPRGFEADRVVYKLPSRAVKLDFIDTVHKLKSEPYRETQTSSLLTSLDALAEKPHPEREAVRNLMTLRLQGPAVDAATAHRNLGMLVDAALDETNEKEQVAAIKKLMKEKGRERLLEMLKD